VIAETDSGFYGYSFGAWVIAEDRCQPEDRCFKIEEQWVNPDLKK